MNKGTKEQQNKGTKEQRNKGTKKQKVHPIGSGITRSPGLVPYLFPNKRFLHHKYANKELYKEFALKRSFVVIL